MKEITKKGYGGAGETQTAKATAISEIVSGQAELFTKAPERTDLRDLAAVQRVAEHVMDRCATLGVLPSMELLAAALGYSRSGIYKNLDCNPDSPTSQYLDALRTGWAAMRIAAADRGAASETVSIFLLLNSSLNYSNRHDVLIETPTGPLDGVSAESAAARERILSSLPLEDEE